MLADDALTDAQTQARSLGPGREERIEDARQCGGRDTGAVVPDLHLDDVEERGLAAGEQPVGRAPAHAPALRRALPRRRHRHGDLTASRERLKGVHEHVQEDLEDLIVVDVKIGHRVGALDAKEHVLANRQLVDEGERLLQGGQDGVTGELRRRWLRELEEAVHDPIESGHLLEDQVGELDAGVPTLDPAL